MYLCYVKNNKDRDVEQQNYNIILISHENCRHCQNESSFLPVLISDLISERVSTGIRKLENILKFGQTGKLVQEDSEFTSSFQNNGLNKLDSMTSRFNTEAVSISINNPGFSTKY